MTDTLELDGGSLYVHPTENGKCRHLKYDLLKTPLAADIDKIADFMFGLFRHDESMRHILHMRHVQSEELSNIELPQCLALVARIMQNKDLAERSIQGIVLQCKVIDGPAEVAKNLFLGLYQPKNFAIVASDEEANDFLAKQERKAAKKAQD